MKPKTVIKTPCLKNKPPIKNRKTRTDGGNDRALSIDARRNDDSLSEKVLSPEAEWKRVLSDIQKKNNWEKQFKACNTIKDFSQEHPEFFKTTDS